MADAQDVNADEQWDLFSSDSGEVTETDNTENENTADDNTADDATDGEAGAEPAQRSRLTYRHLLIGGAVALLLILVIGVGPTGWQILQQKDATIETPPTVAGLTLDTSASAANTTDNLRTALSAGINLDKTVAAVYTDGSAAARSVVFFGGTGLVWSPGKELTDLFDLLADTTGGVQQIKDIPAGSLGGVMRCGVTPFEDGVIPVCGWADHGSVAVGLFLDRPVDEAGTLMATMRTAMEKRA